MGCGQGTQASAGVIQESTGNENAGQSDAAGDDSVVPRRSSSKAFHSQYQLDERIGEGCFARVYACRRLGDGPERFLAVKITDLHGHTRDDTIGHIAHQEATVLRRVGSQKHCCELVDSMTCRRFHYMVLERCSLTLMQALEDMPRLTERSLARVVRQMFLGVQCVHALGIVHRDIKPDNFLCSDGVVKLCDFGLSEVLSSTRALVNGVFGTAPFMSPEMVTGLPYARPTDVWSLGVIVYTFVIGQFPYIPERPCVRLMRAAIACGEPPPSFQCAVPGLELSPQVLALLEALLRREPLNRPTALEALEHGWFAGPSSPEEQPEEQQPCLKATLQAAKQVGAFEMPSGGAMARSSSRASTLDNMDRTLMELQRKYRSHDHVRFGEKGKSGSNVSDYSTMEPTSSREFSSGQSRAQQNNAGGLEGSPSSFRGRVQSYGVLIAT